MAKYDEFGYIAKELFLLDLSTSKKTVKEEILKKYKVKIDHRTICKWCKKDNWEEDRMKKFYTIDQLEDKLRQHQLRFAQQENPNPQLIYAINILMKTVEKQKKDQLINAASKQLGSDEDEIEELLTMRKTLQDTIKTKITAGTSAKEGLEDLQKLDVIIQSTKKLKRESNSEKKVFMFGFDGIDHSEETKNADN